MTLEPFPRPSPISVSRRGALRSLGAAFVVAALTACAPKIRAERVASYPLEAKTSYAWVTEEPVLIMLGDPQPNVRTPANEALLREAIDRELAARGLEHVPQDQADLLVAFSVGTTMRYRLEGGDPNKSMGGIQPGTKQTKGTLNIYLFDRATAHEVWRGSTSKWLSKSEDPADVANTAVAAVMAAYPGAK
jgi:hypothetical protein